MKCGASTLEIIEELSGEFQKLKLALSDFATENVMSPVVHAERVQETMSKMESLLGELKTQVAPEISFSDLRAIFGANPTEG